MDALKLDNNFLQRKNKVLNGLQLDASTTSPDKSPKGYIDEPIIPLIGCINATDTFYTTSSCSGRIALFLQEKSINSKSQKGGKWLFISHECIQDDAIINSIEQYINEMTEQKTNEKQIELSLKFEPFILHIECKDLLSAKQLLALSRETGFRESGINAISNRIMLRIAFNLKLETPLFYGNTSLIRCNKHQLNDCILPNINKNYIKMLTKIANNKMKENLCKINTFYEAFKLKFLPSFKWYTAYDIQPKLLSKKISNKMDLLFDKIDILKQSLSINQSGNTFKNTKNDYGCWCLLVNNKSKHIIYDQLMNLKLIDDKNTTIIPHHSFKYKHNWSYVPIKYELAQKIMNTMQCINKNKLQYVYDLYRNVLATHRNIYSFDIDLLVECVTLIMYNSQWLKILDVKNKNKTVCATCIFIGLCFRILPKLSTVNIRSMLESTIYTRSNNKQWCCALISIMELLYDESVDRNNFNYNLNEIINKFPTKYEKLGDCILFPSNSQSILKCIRCMLSISNMNYFYDIICKYFKCGQIGLQQTINKGIKRESRVKILYDPNNKNGMVKHKENKIWYNFNVTKVMFSSGNLTEKIRMSQIAKPTDIVLDLYAGIGYFTLSFLIHANVKFVYCCEINPNSIESLKLNMKLNKIDSNRYKILEGDNAKTTINLINVVDRVNLGLLPSSEQGWNPAIRALKSIGGILHIHHNVHIDHKQEFLNNMVNKLKQIIQQYEEKQHWNIQILHCEHVKWYAPKISHLVVDVKLN